MKPEDKHYHRHGMQEGCPGDIEPDETGRTEPAKTIRAESEMTINESQLGRDQGQTPADEHIEHFSQIDNETANRQTESMEETVRKEFDTTDFKRVDERDNMDSTEELGCGKKPHRKK